MCHGPSHHPNWAAESRRLEVGTREPWAAYGRSMIVIIAIAIFIGLAYLDKRRRIKTSRPPLGHDVDDVTRQANNWYGSN
jgi:hypothetical protein